MAARLIVLGVVVFAALGLLAGSSPAGNTTEGQTLKNVYFTMASGPLDFARPGQSFGYELNFTNARNSGLRNVRLDVFVGKQTIEKGSLFTDPAPGVKGATRLSVGRHVRLTIPSVKARGGALIQFNARVAKTAKGKVCDRLTVTMAGKVYNYSPSCATVGSGGDQ